MSLASKAKEYLVRLQHEYLQALADGQHTSELSFRTITDSFLHDAVLCVRPNNSVGIVHEPVAQQLAGRPDWLFQNRSNLSIYGYIEDKGISRQAFDPHDYKAQVDKYRSLGRKLMITDGIDFVFCNTDNSSPEAVSLFDKQFFDEDWSLHADPSGFERVLNKFLEDPASRKYSMPDLVCRVAMRCRNLARVLADCCALAAKPLPTDPECEVIRFISELRNFVCRSDARSRLADDKVLIDFVVQIIMFSLLYSRKVSCASGDEPNVRGHKITQFINQTSLPDELGSPGLLMRFVVEHDTHKVVSSWIDECISFLAFSEIDEDGEAVDYHRLFELFLEKYDPEVRWSYGAFFTPKSLATYTIRLAEYVTSCELGQSLYSAGNKIIDPCCGTGSFLEAFIRNKPQSAGLRLFGIEILPAPYMLANYRLASIDRECGGLWSDRVIVLADTLHNDAISGGSQDPSIESKELTRARSVSDLQLQLIIGNPPCSESSWGYQDPQYSRINQQLDDFKPPLVERRGRQNLQKQINNTFVKFLRWSCERAVRRSGMTTIAMVVPISFLEAESYKYARKFLAENFSAIWVVAVDADGRSGIRSNSLFHTLQGRAVLIVTRDVASHENRCSKFHFADFSTVSSEEKDFRLGELFPSAGSRFSQHLIPQGTYSLIPAPPFDEQTYLKFISVTAGTPTDRAIFKSYCSGIKLAPTAMFTHVSKEALVDRTKKIAKTVTGAKVWFARQQKPPADEKLKSLKDWLCRIGSARDIEIFVRQKTIPYAFRPFLWSYVFLWTEFLSGASRLGGGGTRLRPEILKTFELSRPVGFAMAHGPKDLSPQLTQFVSFCWGVPDNDMCTRGNSYIYLDRYYNKNTHTVEQNIDIELARFVSNLVGDRIDYQPAVAVVFYAYAILSSQAYLDEFRGALFTTNQSTQRPRIPIVKDADLFVSIMDAGRMLAELESPDFDPENALGYDYDAIKNHISSCTTIDLSKIDLNASDEHVVIYGDDNFKLKLDCPEYIVNCVISGYNVLSTWFKFHSYAFTHKYFSADDCEELLDLLNKLELRAQTISTLDELVFHAIQASSLYNFEGPRILRGVAEALKYRRYLPVYTMAAACGHFGAEERVEESEEWIEVSGRIRRNPKLYVVRATGHSMEPRIKNGEYCVFEYRDTEIPETNTIVLSEHSDVIDSETEGAYSIKKLVHEDGKMVLRSLNVDPAYEDIELDATRGYRIVGVLKSNIKVLQG